MELSVTPADSLRLWQASSESDNGEQNGNEPGMQAGQWGAAASATSGVRSNATLDSDAACRTSFARSRLLWFEAEVVTIAGIEASVPADPNDNHLLASLIASKADWLITGDSDFDELSGRYPIIAPSEFVRRFL